MPPKRIPPPPSSDDEKDEHLIDGPNSDDEEVSYEDEEQPHQQQIKSSKPTTQTHSESGSEDEEEDEEEEVEEEKQETPPPKKPTSQKPQSPSDSDSGSDSDSELGKTDYSPTASDFAVKPIASKPMGDSTKPKKPTNLKPSAVAAPVAKPTAKRVIEVVEQNGSKDSKSKRKKVSNGDADNEEKKSAVNRLWSEDDEIAILQGMVDYWSKKGADPYADMGAFHEFIKENLHVDVLKNQLTDKIRRLKKKYQNNVEKNGEDAVFSRPHEYKSFELSKKIWGGARSGSGVDDSAKSNNGQAKRTGSKVNNTSNSLAKPKDEGKAIVVTEKAKGKEEIKVASGDFAKMYPYLDSALEVQWETDPFRALSEDDRRLMKEKLGRNSKVQEVNEEFKMLKVKELELYSKKLELMKETTGMFLGALKSDE